MICSPLFLATYPIKTANFTQIGHCVPAACFYYNPYWFLYDKTKVGLLVIGMLFDIWPDFDIVCH
jgi:hypothetical protein